MKNEGAHAGLGGDGHKSGAIPRLVTSETLESLVAQGDGVSYASLSLWLLDATAEEMEAFYINYRDCDFDMDVMRLLFVNWTRLDPMAVLNASKGTKQERLFWWSWAAHDP